MPARGFCTDSQKERKERCLVCCWLCFGTPFLLFCLVSSFWVASGLLCVVLSSVANARLALGCHHCNSPLLHLFTHTHAHTPHTHTLTHSPHTHTHTHTRTHHTHTRTLTHAHTTHTHTHTHTGESWMKDEARHNGNECVATKGARQQPRVHKTNREQTELVCTCPYNTQTGSRKQHHAHSEKPNNKAKQEGGGGEQKRAKRKGETSSNSNHYPVKNSTGAACLCATCTPAGQTRRGSRTAASPWSRAPTKLPPRRPQR